MRFAALFERIADRFFGPGIDVEPDEHPRWPDAAPSPWRYKPGYDHERNRDNGARWYPDHDPRW